ncbi:MAG: YhcN/YlaJ family sporulation lipoprotein [Clostridiales bacterium]|nr:YhcN/YlaJ family sporulation lipoprotein [Clostridiales bacterium]
MKKLLLALLVIAAVALSISQVAFAETECEQKICELAKTNEKVKDAKCVVYERNCVVAIKTEQFTQKSDYETYVKDLIEKVKAECDVEHVFVTRNPKVMKQIEELSKLSEQQRDDAIRKLIEDVIRHRPHVKPMLPKMTSLTW